MAQFTIRIPDEMRERIKAAAAQDIRSLNGEVEWLLDAALRSREISPPAVAHTGWAPDRKDLEET